jgi:hypothetical protein
MEVQLIEWRESNLLYRSLVGKNEEALAKMTARKVNPDCFSPFLIVTPT